MNKIILSLNDIIQLHLHLVAHNVVHLFALVQKLFMILILIPVVMPILILFIVLMLINFVILLLTLFMIHLIQPANLLVIQMHAHCFKLMTLFSILPWTPF